MDPWSDDLYERIGTDPDASRRDIRKHASRAKIRWEERLEGMSDERRERGMEAFERIKEAEAVLTDPERREAYDERRSGDDADDERRSVPLTLDVGSARVMPDEPVTVVVETASGTPVSGVTLSGYDASEGDEDDPEDTATTDDDGKGIVRFRSPGTKTVRAETDEDKPEYEAATARVDVDRPALTVTADPDAIEAGDDVEFRVHVDDDPVEGASLHLPASDETVETGEEGRVTAAIEGEGDVTVRATKTEPFRYEPDSVTVTVFPEPDGPLSVDCEPSTVTEGERFTVTVSYGDDPVSGATVTLADDDAAYETGDEGRCDIVAEGGGRTEVHAETPRGDTATGVVIVERRSTGSDETDEDASTTTDTDHGVTVRVESESKEFEVGDAATVAVERDGEPVSDASVKINDLGTGTVEFETVGEDGTLTYSFPRSGRYVVTALRETSGGGESDPSIELLVREGGKTKIPEDSGDAWGVRLGAVVGLLVVVGLLGALVWITSVEFVVAVGAGVLGLSLLVKAITAIA